jgi:RNA polymerase sigma-70 factor (ECF subfamily)
VLSCVISTSKRVGAALLAINRLTTELLKSLYEKHGAALVAYARCSGLDFASAEDVVQQVFLKLLRGSGISPQIPLAYLFRAVRNASLNHRRNRHRETQLPESETWFVHPKADPAELLALQNALRKLSADQRETVFLRVWSGMTLQEVADVMEVSLNTVASRYRYALEKLRELLGKKPGKVGMDHAGR